MASEENLEFINDANATFTVLPAPASLVDWRNSLDSTSKAVAVAASAREGHMAGFWSLPEMIGEIRENVLFGGGLAPADIKYGTRPVTYVIYIAGGTRRAVEQGIVNLGKVLAAGNIETSHHGHGVTIAGYLAAPPEVEWLGNITNTAKISFTMTYLDPAVYGLSIGNPSRIGKIFTGSMAARNDEYAYIAPWQEYETNEYDRHFTTFTVTNKGSTTAYPIVGVDLAALGSAENRSGFGLGKNVGSGNMSYPQYGWYAFSATLTGVVVLNSLTGASYRTTGGTVGRYGNILYVPDELALAPGEKATYTVHQIGDDQIGMPITQQRNKAALMFAWGRY